MPTLLLRLAGPMQSWGTRSRFNDRDTERIPSKSGVIGLLCAASGIPRDAPPERLVELASLRMGVRVDRPGTLQTDYHTALPPEPPPGRGGRARRERQGAGAITWRHYLADAVFLVGLEGPERLLRELHDALRAPVWPLCLGRRSFPPGLPLWLPDGLRDAPLEVALRDYPWLPARPEAALPPPRPPRDGSLEAELECPPGEDGELRQDVPLSFDWERRAFTVRRVRRVHHLEVRLPEPADGPLPEGPDVP
ncbi:MAG: type I-E CRISPR-associated protein Cas5/CasD [Armatimonadetes bacterium]|nr:type I-E CRISPR-associated protein Cas5/CasD [Armatimonadota bacterium]